MDKKESNIYIYIYTELASSGSERKKKNSSCSLLYAGPSFEYLNWCI